MFNRFIMKDIVDPKVIWITKKGALHVAPFFIN